jgi:hypothetical protein
MIYAIKEVSLQIPVKREDLLFLRIIL